MPPFIYQEKSMEKRIFDFIEKVATTINKCFLWLASINMGALVIIICLDLTLRYFFNSPLIWATEITEISLLYITFLGTAWVFREDGHVVIDIFTGKAVGRKKDILTMISYMIVGMVSALLIYYGFITTYDHFKRKVFNPTIMETPIALIIMIIPIGSIPLFLEFLLKGRKTLYSNSNDRIIKQ